MKISFKSIRSQIVIIIVLGVVLTTLVISILLKVQLEKSLLTIHNSYAKNMVSFLKLNVASQHKSILYHKTSILELRKSELKAITELTKTIVNNRYKNYLQGNLSESNAKKLAIKEVSQLRHSNNIGYFWINDTVSPYPKMISHPIMPYLNGQILDDTTFNCALGKNRNLFKAFVDVCLRKGNGYVDYLWPKPTASEISGKQPKISYVTLFKPWGWIIGTGLYIDDLQKDVDKKVNSVIDELNPT